MSSIDCQTLRLPREVDGCLASSCLDFFDGGLEAEVEATGCEPFILLSG